MTINHLNNYEVNDYATKKDLEKLTHSINDLCLQLAHFNISHGYLVNSIESLSKQVSVINERNLKQDTMFALIGKLWKISPYIIAIIFFITLTLTESSFDFSEFMIKFLQKFI